MTRLKETDHGILDKFIGIVLDAYKSGERTKPEAIADIAHLCTALDLGVIGDDPVAYMLAMIEDISDTSQT